MKLRKVFIHTNAKQRIGAQVARHALQRHSRDARRFEVEILDAEDWPLLAQHEGRRYLREGRRAVWRNDDLQSFTPLRFAVPELMAYAGRALVIDPDVFAVGDVNELLDRDMGGAAILARRMDAEGRRPLHYASSVMLLDCGSLRHWKMEDDFERLFRGEVDYRDWMWLLSEAPGSIGLLDPAWNDFDHLGPATKMLHNTRRRTQPWKTGLPADFTLQGSTPGKRIAAMTRHALAALTGGPANGHYRPHPDPAQERFFFRLLGECLESGRISAAVLEAEIECGHVRADAFDRVRQAQSEPQPARAAVA